MKKMSAVAIEIKLLKLFKFQLDELKAVHDFYYDYFKKMEKKLLYEEFIHLEMIRTRTNKAEAMLKAIFKLHQ